MKILKLHNLLAKVFSIPRVEKRMEDIIKSVDGVILIDDITMTHQKKAPFFINEGVPTFIDKPHIAYSVDNLDEASKGLKVLIEPFEVGGFVRAGFYEYKDGTVVELMQFLRSKSEWFSQNE